MKKIFLFSTCLIFSLTSIAQYIISSDEVDSNYASPWLVEDKLGYIGPYHFGESEGESTLLILVAGDIVCAQEQAGSFEGDGANMIWLKTFVTYSNVRIEGNHFYSDQKNGEFVKIEEDEDPVGGLLIDGEIGYESGSIELSFAGKFPFASFEILTDYTLSIMTKDELKIARNEIFARYGYTFRKGGAMEAYFMEQTWYEAQYENVDAFLTEIELENIRLIKLREAK